VNPPPVSPFNADPPTLKTQDAPLSVVWNPVSNLKKVSNYAEILARCLWYLFQFVVTLIGHLRY
jgi:hypothetical protein